MPLLIALLALVATLALGVVLGVVGLVRRPFRAPTWRPAFAWPLVLRAAVLAVGLVIAFAIAAWRHPDALGGLAFGLGVGTVLGGGAGASAALRRGRAFLEQRPNRVFMVLLAVAVLARASFAALEGFHALPLAVHATLPMLGGLLAGYPLAQAVVLRARLRRYVRLRPVAPGRIVDVPPFERER